MRGVAAFAFFLVLAVLLTWPLAAELPTAVADPGDPLLNAWILDWVSHTLFRAPLQLFDAPIFHPATFPLALSEHMTGVALLVVPFHAAGVGAVPLHGIAMLLSFALSGFGAFVLARTVTGDTLASLAAGVFYAFVSFKFDHLAHVQVIASGWIPLTLAALLQFWRSGTRRDGWFFAAAFTMNGLTNIYWLMFTGFAVIATIVVLEATGRRFDRRRLAVALLASAGVLLPFLIPYQVVSSRYRMYRTSFESLGGSATWGDWLAASPASLLYARHGAGAEERHLFPGVLPIVLAMAGAMSLRWVGPAADAPRHRRTLLALAVVLTAAGIVMLRWHRSDIAFALAATCAAACLPFRRAADPAAWVAVLWVAIGFAGSFGERGFLHPFLFRVFEPLKATRTPARWAVIAYCGLAILMAVGAARFRRARPLLLALAIVEVIPRITWAHVPAGFPPVYRWLAQARPACAIELPIGWNEREAYYVLASSVHHVPIMNGVSGFEPPLHAELSHHVYDDGMLDLIARNGATVVIVHPAAAAQAAGWIRRGRLVEIARFPDGDAAYRMAAR